MRIGNYFKNKQQEPADPAGPVVMEKPATPSQHLDLPLQSTVHSSRSSFSNGSTLSSTVLDDIKHEVMVNYLYQRQCANSWVSDGSGDVEGVVIRKSRNHYLACPPQLGSSPFAVACAALNVQVSRNKIHGALDGTK